jgi:hypothetical protein
MKPKYTLREQIVWHLQGFLVLVAGVVVITLIIGSIVLMFI